MTKQLKTRLVVYTILAIITTAFIFSNSLKSGEESHRQSEGLVAWVESIFDPNDEIPTEEFNLAVRKVAHGLEFTLLGFFLGGLTGCICTARKRLNISAPLLCGILIAVADEFIQSFSDRTSSVADVMIDFGGVVFGAAASILLYAVSIHRASACRSEHTT